MNRADSGIINIGGKMIFKKKKKERVLVQWIAGSVLGVGSYELDFEMLSL